LLFFKNRDNCDLFKVSASNYICLKKRASTREAL